MTSTAPNAPEIATPSGGPPPPRPWWPDGPLLGFVAWIVAWAGIVVSGILIVIGAVVVAGLTGTTGSAALAEVAGHTSVLVVGLLGSQAVMVGVALTAVALLRVSPVQRLGLVPPRTRWWESVAIVVATIVPVSLGLLLATVMPWRMESLTFGMERMWSHGSRGTSVMWVLLIAAAPGFAEELFYRGLLQRSFLVRWGVVPAILVSSALFAIAHLDPAHAAFTFVVGVWFGVVAWRTGSIVLPIVMHATMNGTWTTIQMVLTRRPLDERLVDGATVGTIAVGAIAFVVAVMALRRQAPPPVDSAQPLRKPTSRPRRWPLWTAASLAAVALALAAIIPPGASAGGIAGAQAAPPTPTVASLRAVAQIVECPSDGDVAFDLPAGGAVRVVLPDSRAGVDELFLAYDTARGTLWLLCNGEVSGKRASHDRPPAGVLEQLVAGDPTVACLHLTPSADGLSVHFSLLQEQSAIDAAWERTRIEGGWATRGRKAPSPRVRALSGTRRRGGMPHAGHRAPVV